MTRETKIGLLVGLAFIIVIGILLSDHLTSTTEPPPAHLAQAGSSVRQGVSVPGVAVTAPPVTAVAPPAVTTVQVQQPVAVAPPQPVPTRDELTTPPPAPQAVVQIGPAGTTVTPIPQVPPAAQAPIHVGPTGEAAVAIQPPTQNSVDSQGVTFVPPTPTEATGQLGLPADGTAAPVDPNTVAMNPTAPTAPADPAAADPLNAIAQRIGEALVNPDGSPVQQTALANTNGAVQPTPVRNGFKEYKAVEGDTVSKMAGRFLGQNTPANRDLIIKANPSLQKNPNIVVAGRTYQIPITQPAQSAVASASDAPVTAAPEKQAPAVAKGPEYFYTVKPGDSLWKIANDQLGSAGAVSAIKELNKDTLKGRDTVQVGMKLRLPAKPIASAT